MRADPCREAKKDGKKKLEAANKNWEGLRAFNNWKFKGKEMDKNGRPKLSKDAAVAIVKTLLCKIAPTEKASEYNGMVKAIDRLMEVGDGSSWILEMEKLEVEFTAARGGAPRMF